MRTMILIPTLEPDFGIVGYVQRLSNCCQGVVLVVDCGSGPEYFDILNELAAISNCVVLTGERGKGAALKAGFIYFLKMRDFDTYKGVVLADSDEEYRVDDINSVADQIEEKNKIVVGARNVQTNSVSPKTGFNNDLMKKLLKFFYHIQLSDPQTGLIGFPKSIVPRLLQGKSDCGPEMLLMCARNSVEICEVPIEAPSFRGSSGRSCGYSPTQEFLRTLRLFFDTFLKFVFSSLSASVIDIFLFALMIHTVFTTNTKSIFAATCIARVVSSLYNYMINRKLVFSSRNNVKAETAEFFCLTAGKMLCSAALVSSVTLLLPKFPSVNKLAVDFLLFFAGYYIQRRYIFRDVVQGKKQ